MNTCFCGKWYNISNSVLLSKHNKDTAKIGLHKVTKTATKSLDHHQSSKSLVAAVAQISSEIASKFGFKIDIDPQHLGKHL